MSKWLILLCVLALPRGAAAQTPDADATKALAALVESGRKCAPWDQNEAVTRCSYRVASDLHFEILLNYGPPGDKGSVLTVRHVRENGAYYVVARTDYHCVSVFHRDLVEGKFVRHVLVSLDTGRVYHLGTECALERM